MTEKIIFNSDDYIDCGYREPIGVAIVCAPTGVLCTVQAGGMACAHPKTEGYTVPLSVIDGEEFSKALKDFDDCKWGCWNYDFEDEHLNKYASEIDKFLLSSVNDKNEQRVVFNFDYERIKELMEGWWPVLIKFKRDEYNGYKRSEELYEAEFKGYLHFGNCD